MVRIEMSVIAMPKIRSLPLPHSVFLDVDNISICCFSPSTYAFWLSTFFYLEKCNFLAPYCLKCKLYDRRTVAAAFHSMDSRIALHIITSFSGRVCAWPTKQLNNSMCIYVWIIRNVGFLLCWFLRMCFEFTFSLSLENLSKFHPSPKRREETYILIW